MLFLVEIYLKADFPPPPPQNPSGIVPSSVTGDKMCVEFCVAS